jgi:hypothetical protein
VSFTILSNTNRYFVIDTKFTLEIGLIYYWQEVIGEVIAHGVRSRKLNNVGHSSDGSPKICYIELLCASEDKLSRWSNQSASDPHRGL